MAATLSGSIRKVGMSDPRWNCPAMRSRPASRRPEMLPSGSSPEAAPSKSVVLTNARFFAGQKASPCPRRSFFSVAERRFGRCRVFLRSKNVCLPEEKSGIAQKASFWPGFGPACPEAPVLAGFAALSSAVHSGLGLTRIIGSAERPARPIPISSAVRFPPAGDFPIPPAARTL